MGMNLTELVECSRYKGLYDKPHTPTSQKETPLFSDEASQERPTKALDKKEEPIKDEDPEKEPIEEEDPKEEKTNEEDSEEDPIEDANHVVEL